MGSLCFSSAALLRCVSFDRLQNAILLIPTGLEVIFTTSLIFINWNAGRQHLLLTVEGWIFLVLSIIDVLSHILPAAREDINIFRAFDLAVGITSFLPLLFYTVFLYLFTRAELLYTLPRRVQKTAKLLLLAFIPAIIVMHVVASFVGVQIREVNSIILIGFPTPQSSLISTFFTSLTLALLTAFQALVFCFAFYRLIHALLSQRRIESTSADAAHLVNGIGWICAAIKLGAIETVVGFAGGGFEVVFTRRILRFLGRALLSIGLAKGVDAMEDFRAVQNEMTSASLQRKTLQRGSTLRAFISNPRLSTFQQLTPTASAFRSPSSALPNMGQFSRLRDEVTQSQGEKGQRVTVHYPQGAAPILHMRFSSLGLPSPSIVADTVKARGKTEWLTPPGPMMSQRNSVHSHSNYAPSLMAPAEIITAPQRSFSQKSARAQVIHTPHTGPSRETTLDETLLVVQELAPQFPLTPTSATRANLEPGGAQGWDADTISIPPSAASSEGFPPRLTREEKGKEPAHGEFEYAQHLSPAQNPVLQLTPQPTPFSSPSSLPNPHPPAPAQEYSTRGGPFDEEDGDRIAQLLLSRSNRNTFGAGGGHRTTQSTLNTLSFISTASPLSGYTQHGYAPTMSGYSQTVPTSAVTPDEENPFLDLGSVLDARANAREWKQEPNGGMARNTEWLGSNGTVPLPSSTASDLIPPMELIDSAHRTPLTTSTSHTQNLDALTIPWLKNPAMEEEDRRLARARPDLARIKSVGKAPRRETPAPTRAKAPRGSTHLERLIIPPPRNTDRATEIIQGSVPSIYSGSGVLRDSEVLGIEDGSIVRDIKRAYQ